MCVPTARPAGRGARHASLVACSIMAEKLPPVLRRIALAAAQSSPTFIRLQPEYQAISELVEAIEGFDAGDLPGAMDRVEWLREYAFRFPEESATRLYMQAGRLLGFYALANGQVELMPRQVDDAGGLSKTQPAVLLTQIARAYEAEGAGTPMFLHALGVARRATYYSAATVIGLDPDSEEVAERVWREKYGFRDSKQPGPGRDLPRMWRPLEVRAG